MLLAQNKRTRIVTAAAMVSGPLCFAKDISPKG